MRSKNLADGVRPREVWAWAMYDFANSGYTTVVITAIFNAYFVAVVAQGEDWGTLAWSAALAVSYFLVMVTAPALGAYADAWASKKRLLLASTIGCVLFTAGLALVGRGDLYLAIPLIILSNFFFGVGENLIAAFLPELAKGEAMGRVSGWGWSIGFLGGLLSLGASLAYVTWAEGQGQSAAQFVPVTMLITAGLFAFAALPTFLILRERAVPQPHLQGRGVLSEAFSRLGDTLQHARRYRDLGRFLVCLVFYQAGIQAVIALAAIYAQQAMHFGTRETIMLVLLVNVTAAVGAFAVRPDTGPAGPYPHHFADAAGLDTHDPDCLPRRNTGPVLGCRQHHRPVPRCIPVGGAGIGRLHEPAGAQCGIFWLVGAGGKTLRHTRAAHLRPGELDIGRGSPPGHPDDRQLFSGRPGAAQGRQCRARAAFGLACR